MGEILKDACFKLRQKRNNLYIYGRVAAVFDNIDLIKYKVITVSY